jgi:23S rRNA (pseudouridine1915-N3)-methyltransferase
MIYCVFPGAFKDEGLHRLTLDYHRRLERLWPVTLFEIVENNKEILKMIEAKKNRAILVSLDAHGESMDSAQFIQWVTSSSQDVYFFAWGASGPPPELKAHFTKSISLSPMTYSHELARTMLLEQLYRAGATLKGHPYPK